MRHVCWCGLVQVSKISPLQQVKPSAYLLQPVPPQVPHSAAQQTGPLLMLPTHVGDVSSTGLLEALLLVEAGACGGPLCTAVWLRDAGARRQRGGLFCTAAWLHEAEGDGPAHDDQALSLPAFALTTVPLTRTSRAGGSRRSCASKGVPGSSANRCTKKSAQTAEPRLPSPCSICTACVSFRQKADEHRPVAAPPPCSSTHRLGTSAPRLSSEPLTHDVSFTSVIM